MTTTPGDEPSGWLVPPLWLQAHDLSQEDLDELKARFLAACHGPVVVLRDPPRWRRWWDWPAVQWWWHRQYKRADRRAFKRECEQIRWRGTWRPDGA
jgi:hypothetical protein